MCWVLGHVRRTVASAICIVVRTDFSMDGTSPGCTQSTAHSQAGWVARTIITCSRSLPLRASISIPNCHTCNTVTGNATLRRRDQPDPHPSPLKRYMLSIEVGKRGGGPGGGGERGGSRRCGAGRSGRGGGAGTRRGRRWVLLLYVVCMLFKAALNIILSVA